MCMHRWARAMLYIVSIFWRAKIRKSRECHVAAETRADRIAWETVVPEVRRGEAENAYLSRKENSDRRLPSSCRLGAVLCRLRSAGIERRYHGSSD